MLSKELFFLPLGETGECCQEDQTGPPGLKGAPGEPGTVSTSC